MSGKSLGALYHNLNLFYIFHSSLLLHFSCLVFALMHTNFRQHCLGGGGGRKGRLSINLFEINYMIFVYYAEWKVINHPVRGGIPTSSATHDIYTMYT